MKLSAAAFSLLLFVGSTSAQYFSVGWAPGQKVSSQTPPAKSVVPPQGSSTSQTAAASEKTPSTSTPNSFIEKLLTFGPAAALLSSFGVDVSAAINEKLWDERIQLITDDNYQHMIVNETLTSKEEKERTWVILITGQAVRQDELSKFADNVFDTAYDQTLKAGDLPHVRWGRIDYLNVTRLTTKWGVWQVPHIVIITDRGQTLRFYRHYQVRLRAENMREFLKTKGYLLTPPWSTAYSPGGEREYILDHFATIVATVYSIANVFPRWLLLIASGGIASLLMGLLHRSSKKPATPKTTSGVIDEKKPPSKLPPAPIVPAATTNTQSNGTALTSASKPAAALKPAPDSSKSVRAESPPKSAAKVLTPAATDSERESSAKPTKRSSTRPKKPKKTSS